MGGRGVFITGPPGIPGVGGSFSGALKRISILRESGVTRARLPPRRDNVISSADATDFAGTYVTPRRT